MSGATRADFENALTFLALPNSVSHSDLSVVEWFGLCVALKQFGLLGVSVPTLRRAAPAIVARKIEAWKRSQDSLMKRRSSTLASFAEESCRQNLHFVVLKGMASSKLLYGDAFARQSGDIDILVAPDDVPKADYVARVCGWYQPGEARLVRPLQDCGKLDAATLHRLQSPYTLRSNVILPHMTNYYFPYADGTFDSLEVHDRFFGMPSSNIGSLLWDLQEIEIAGKSYLTPSNELSVIVSALSLYEDAETIRANTSLRSDLGLKVCYDLFSFLHNERSTPIRWDGLFQHLSALGVTDRFAQSVQDMQQVFPCEFEMPEFLQSTANSVWDLPYAERVLNSRLRVHSGLKIVADLLANRLLLIQDRYSVGSDWAALASNDGKNQTSFKGRFFNLNSGVFGLTWRLPVWAVRILDRLVLQGVVLSPEMSSSAIGYRLNVFFEDDEWKGFVREMTANSVDGHANRIARGLPVKVRAQRTQDNVDVTAYIDFLSTEVVRRSSTALLSIWECVYGQLYRKVAGIDSMEMLETVFEL